MPNGSYTDGHRNTDAWLRICTSVVRSTISSTHTTLPRRAWMAAARSRNSAPISGVSGAPAHRTTWAVGVDVDGRLQGVLDALLPGHAADEDHRRPVGVDAEAGERVGAGVGLVLVGVDSVGDHDHPGRVDRGVRLQDVGPHAGGHGDDRVGGLDGRPLAPRRQVVAGAQLLRLPRPAGLQAVGGHHVGDPVEDLGQVPAQVGVPGVGVDDVGPGGPVAAAMRRSTESTPRTSPFGPAATVGPRRVGGDVGRPPGARRSSGRRGRPAGPAPGSGRRRGRRPRRRPREGTPGSGGRPSPGRGVTDGLTGLGTCRPLPITTTPFWEMLYSSPSASWSTPIRAPAGTITFLSMMARRTMAPAPTTTSSSSTESSTRE